MVNEMWSNEDEFLQDLETMGEIWENKTVQNNDKRNFQIQQPTNKIRSIFLDDSDDDENPEDVIENGLDENDPMKLELEVRRKIEEATGHMHSNDIVMEYFQADKFNQKPLDKIENVEKHDTETDKHKVEKSSFATVSNFDIDKLKPINTQGVPDKPKTVRRVKKSSVADMIQNSIKPKKKDEPKNVTEKSNKENSPIKKEENITLPDFMGGGRKILSNGPAPRSTPSNRFSLPIHNDGYKDYYSGEKLAELDEISDDFYIQQTGKCDLTDYEPITSSESYISDRYSYRDDFSIKSDSSEKILDINSAIDFPPLA